MSSSLRLSIIMVLVLATVALGLIAYTAYLPKPVAQAVQNAPAPLTQGYYVAAHDLPAGTFVRDEDFEARPAVRPGDVPSGAILESNDARIELRGSLVRNFVDAGHPITSRDILRPRDRGFLASVLAPDTRAISINVDAESGVSGLIWPGDYVDVVLAAVLTQSDKEDLLRRSLSGIVLHNVRVVAIDQEIVRGVSGANAAAGKVTKSVSLQLSPEQVKKITLARDLGKLTLAARAAEVTDRAAEVTDRAVEVTDRAVDVTGPAGWGAMLSPALTLQNAIARRITTVVVYGKRGFKKYTVMKQDFSDSAPTPASTRIWQALAAPKPEK